MKRSTLFFIASIVFYLACIVGFITGVRRIYAVVWLCIGSAFLALGNSERKKESQDEDDDGNGDENDAAGK